MPSSASGRDIDDLITRMIEHMPPYDGKDDNTSDDWYCKSCFKHESEEDVRLLICGCCKSVRYCSRECQKEDFKDHRTECRRINSLLARMEEQAQELRSHVGWTGVPENLFESKQGHFWGILETRDYCRTRYELASELQHLAHWYEVKPLLEMALGHQVELLRLMASDNLGVRDVLPFTLLSLNRDDDSYAFIKYWIPNLEKGDTDYDLHENSAPGDWIYPEGGARFEDVFEVLDCSEDYFSLAFLAALLIIKLRIIAAYEEKLKQSKKKSETFSQTNMAKRLDDSVDHIEKQMTKDCDGYRTVIKEQEKHVQRYFRIMRKNNPSLLPAIVNPGPLKSQPAPAYVQHGKPSEAWEVLNRCNRHFVRIPGVEKRIEGMVGKNPRYDYHVERGM